MNILVTGGAGYIGAHTCVELINTGHDIVILDNFSNSSPLVLDRIARITGKQPLCIEADIRDRAALAELFAQHTIDAVIHFAGLKAVGESVEQPARYYENNIVGSLYLFEAMAQAGVKTLVFSSSATVYGDPEQVPIRENARVAPTNPYGRSKLMIEDILRDFAHANDEWRIALLRYFNPVGAHSSGLIGEDPSGIPNNLMPYISQVAVGRLAELSVFGDDYPTADGTGVRDYIHVVDLALGHLAALKTLSASNGILTINLGTGRGYSVLEMIRAFEQASGKTIPYRIVARRPGDVATVYADPSAAQKHLGWQAKRGIADMCRDIWHWQSTNPDGFRST